MPLILGAFALRLAWLDADASFSLSWSGAPFTDEGLYSHAARNRALFGVWRTDEWDNRLVSPLFDLCAYLVFRVFGVGYVQLRSINVVLATLALPLWWAFLRRDFGSGWALLGLALWGFNYFWFQYSRLGLLEPGMVVWMVASAWCWRRSLNGNVWWAVACGICAAIAWVWKSLALVFVPVPLLAVLLLRYVDWRRIGTGYVAGVAIVAAVYAAVWYVPNAAELTRYNQFYAADRIPPSFAAAWNTFHDNIRSPHRTPYLIGQAPLLVYVALAGAICAVVSSWQRGVRPATAFCLMWLVCGMTLLAMPYTPPRYVTLLVPPLIGLSLSLVHFAPLRRYGMFLLVLCLLVAHIAWDGYRYVQWAQNRSTTLPDSSRALQQIIPAGTMVLGVTACGLSLENTLPCAPLIAGLANDDDPIERLNTRYVMVETNNRDDFIRRFYPGQLPHATRLETLPLGPRRVAVYRLSDTSP